MFESVVVSVDLEQRELVPKLFVAARANLNPDSGTLHVVAVVQRFQSALVGSFFPKDFEAKLLAKATQQLDELVNAQELDGITPHPHIAHGTIYEEIIHVADQVGAELIVIAASGSDRKDFLLGPHAARVARHAKQSVMVIRG